MALENMTGTESGVLDFFNADQSQELVSPNQLDFSTAENALGDLAGFNLDQFQSQTPTAGTSLESLETTTTDTTRPWADILADHERMKKQNQDFATRGIRQTASRSQNPYLPAAQYEFDQYATNVDRYRGYGKETFNRVGFNPIGDNEARYNANTTGWQDFKRMTGHYGELFNTAFFSNWNSITEFFTGENRGDILSGDEEAAFVFDKSMRLGSSSRGGVWGGLTNFTLNTAYTAGIAANVFAEEMLMALGSAITGFAGKALTAGRTAKNISRLGRATVQTFKFATRAPEVGSMFKGGYQMLKSLKHLDNARDFYRAIRTGATTFGKGAFNFFNPLRGTTDLLRTSPTTFKSMSNFAKLSRGAGAFYRDIRENWFALSEAQLEGGSQRLSMLQDLIADYRSKNGGQLPDQETLNSIYETADNAGRLTTLINIPLIYTSNRFTFDGLFNFKGIRALTEAAEEFGGKGLAKGWKFDLSSRSFVKAGEGFLKSTKSVFKNPKIWAGTFLNYTKANVAEGLQELLQETTSGAVRNYYTGVYKNPTLGGYDYAKASVYSALGTNVFSTQGLHTFLSGFAMGAPMRGASKFVTGFLNKTANFYMKKVTPEKYDLYKKQKEQAERIVGETLNKMVSDPEAFFSRRKESLVNQKKANDNMLLAQSQNDDKAYYDAKDDKTFDSVFTALHNGSYDMLVEAFEDMKGLSDKELAEAFNLEEGTKAKEKLNEYIGRAKQIKKNFDVVQDRYPNPFHPEKYDATEKDLRIKEVIAYKAFEDAKKTAILAGYGFERAVERMNGIMQNLQTDPFIAEAAGSDFTILQSRQTLKDEIKILKNEIKSLKDTTDPEQKKVLKEKEKKLEALEEYYNEFVEYEDNKGKEEVNDRGQIVIPFNPKTEKLKAAFNKYAKVVANIRNSKYVFNEKVDTAFNSILDYYQLDNDAKRFTRVINALLDPEILLKHAGAINDALFELFEKREEIAKESVSNYLNVVQLDALITSLGKIGVIIDPDQLEDLYQDGKMPTRFFDLKSNTIIDELDARYQRIIEIVKAYVDLRTKQEDVEVTPAEQQTPTQQQTAQKATQQTSQTQQPAQQTATQAQPAATQTKPSTPSPAPAAQPAVTQQLDPELEKKLRAAYDEFKQFSPDSDMTFEEYIAPEEEGGSAKAANIRKQFEKEKGTVSQQPAQQPAQEVSQKPVEKTIQTNPEKVGENTEVIVVKNQSERPDVFDEWKDPQILNSGTPRMAIAKHTQDIYEFGQKLDKEGASWTIGSLRAEVAGRRIVDVFADGKRFLVYKSTGEGTGPESKGEWVPLFGFAQNGWFIKTMWNGENPKFNKYESKTFKAIHDYLKANDEQLFSGKPGEVIPAVAESTPAPVSDIKAEKKRLIAERDAKIEKEAPIKDLGKVEVGQLFKSENYATPVVQLIDLINAYRSNTGINKFTKEQVQFLLKNLEFNAIELAKLGIKPDVHFTQKELIEKILNHPNAVNFSGSILRKRGEIFDKYRGTFPLYFVFGALNHPSIKGTGLQDSMEFSFAHTWFTDKSQDDFYYPEIKLKVNELKNKEDDVAYSFPAVQALRWAYLKQQGKTNRSLAEYMLDTQKEIRDEYQQKIDVLEGVKSAEVKPEQVKAEPVVTPAPTSNTAGSIYPRDKSNIKKSFDEYYSDSYTLREEAKKQLVDETKKPLFGKKTEPTKAKIEERMYEIYENAVSNAPDQISNTLEFSVYDGLGGFVKKYSNTDKDTQLNHKDLRHLAEEQNYKYDVYFNPDGKRVANIRVPVLNSDNYGNNRPSVYASITMFVPDNVNIDGLVTEFFNKLKNTLGELNSSPYSWTSKTDYNKRVTTQDIIQIFEPIATKYLKGEDAGSQAAIVEQQVATPVVKKTGVQKAQDILNKIKNLSELPNSKLTDSSATTTQLLELVAGLELKSKDLLDLIEAKKQELLKNLSAKDFEKGYFVTFTDGRKGWVNSKLKDGLKMKMVGSEQGVYETIPYNNLPNMVEMIEKNKKVSPEPVEKVEIAPEDKKAVEASKDTRQEFSKDIGKVQQSTNDAKEKSKDGVNNSFNDLLNGLGCKTD